MSVVSGIVGAIAGKRAADAQVGAARDAAAVSERIFDQTRDDYAPFREVGVSALNALAFESGVGPRPGGTTTTGALPPIQTILGNPRLVTERKRTRTRIGDDAEWAETQKIVSGPSTYAVNGKPFNSLAEAQAYAQATAAKTTTPGYRGFEASPSYQFRVSEGNRAIDASASARGGLFSGATRKEQMRFNQGIAAQEYNNYVNRLAALAGVGQSATGSVAAAGQANAANQGNALMNAGAARASGYRAIGQGIQTGIQGIGQIAGFGRGQGWF